jgi:hypothetical protein
MRWEAVPTCDEAVCANKQNPLSGHDQNCVKSISQVSKIIRRNPFEIYETALSLHSLNFPDARQQRIAERPGVKM